MARKKSTQQQQGGRFSLRNLFSRNKTQTRQRGNSGSSSRTKSQRDRRIAIPEPLKNLRVRRSSWQDFIDALPPWADEVAAIVLVVVGVVSLLALLNFSPQGTFTSSWAEGIRQLFGLGGFFVAFGILALGIFILLPKLGIVIYFPWQRVFWLEVAFFSLLAILHLAANDPEPQALARAGDGGGYIGWVLSQLIARLFDTLTAGVVYLLILVFAISQIIGISRRQVNGVIEGLTHRLDRIAERLESYAEAVAKPPRPPVTQPPPRSSASSAAATPGTDPNTPARRSYRPTRPSVVPRDPDAERQPHVTPKPAAPTTKTPADAGQQENADPPAPRPDPSTLPGYIQPSEDKLRRGLSSPGLPGERASIVPRDEDESTNKQYQPASPVPRARRSKNDRKVLRDKEGRRYFRVNDLKEARRTGRRASMLPGYDQLQEHEINLPTDEEINNNARIIEDTLADFDIHVEVIDVKIGPTVTQYAVRPFKDIVTEDGEVITQRVRVGKIAALENDLALALSARRLRIEAPVPGFSYVGVEVPNREPSVVSLRGVIESATYYRNKKPLVIPLGRDVSGESFVTDLAKMPHLLIAGTTGSGKSVALASLTTALLMNNTPDQLKLVLLDPKMVELTRFNGLPHMLGPVETDQERIVGVLRWCAREMDRRYKLLEVEAARNLESYNRALGRRRKDEHLPYIVVIFDEIGDLMLSRPEETEKMLTRLAQMARAVGIHLVVATQRPSVDVITGLIKANFPARISFAVASGVDSRVILDTTGAETLIGRGDLLFLASDAAGPIRLQGCYIADEEIEAVVNHWREWHANEIQEGNLIPPATAPWERGVTRREILSETDPLLEDAIKIVMDAGEASASLIQRRLGVGYPRAARLMDLMYELGIIGEARAGGRTREVLYKPGDDPFRKLIEQRAKGQ